MALGSPLRNSLRTATDAWVVPGHHDEEPEAVRNEKCCLQYQLLDFWSSLVNLFHRGIELNPANPIAWAQFNGFLAPCPDLGMTQKWRFMHQILASNPAPPADTLDRVARLPTIVRHAGVAWTGARCNGSNIIIETTNGAQVRGSMPIGLSGVGFGVPRPARGIRRQLFTEEADLYEEGMKTWQASGIVTNA